MTARIKANVFCWCLIAIFVAGRSAESGAVPVNSVPVSIEQDAQHLTDALTAQGFQVTRGYVKLYTQEDCDDYSYDVMKSCFGNNPAAPYVQFNMEYWPGEFEDPATQYAFGFTPEGYTTSFRFDPREAVVILGRMPPPAEYFGIQTYVFTREGTFKTDSPTYQLFLTNPFYNPMLDTFFAVVPNNTNRIQLFASLSNSNNNVVIRNQSGSVFNQERFFIITPDQYMNNAVRKALAGIFVKDKYIFTEPIPSTMTTGLDAHADDFLVIMRYAMPHDVGGPGSPSHKWRTDLPLVVLRVKDTNNNRTSEPYGPPVLDKRTAVDESYLASDLTKLVVEVNRRWGQQCTKADCSDRARDFVDLQPPPINFVGPLCTEIGMNCLGDGQDATYQMTPNLNLDQGEIYAVAATLGTKTGNATYVGLGVNASLKLKGVGNVESDQLQNTANSYASEINNPDKFYLYYFTRDCTGLEDLTGGNCLSITTDMVAVCTESDPDSPLCDHLKLSQREYIKKGTERGPDSTLVLLPKLIMIKKQ